MPSFWYDKCVHFILLHRILFYWYKNASFVSKQKCVVVRLISGSPTALIHCTYEKCVWSSWSSSKIFWRTKGLRNRWEKNLLTNAKKCIVCSLQTTSFIRRQLLLACTQLWCHRQASNKNKLKMKLFIFTMIQISVLCVPV